MRSCAMLVLAFNLALAGCASCYIDALPQSPSEPSTALDCDPLLAAR
jgi:hypothetical protein